MKEPREIILNTCFIQMKTAWFQAARMTSWKSMPAARIQRYHSFSLGMPCFPEITQYKTILADWYSAEG